MKDYLTDKRLWVAGLCLTVSTLVTLACIIMITNHNNLISASEFEVPVNWDSDYFENEEDYNRQQELNMSSVETFGTDLGDMSFYTVTCSTTVGSNSYADINTPSRTLSDIQIISMSESEAWEYISNGLFKSYPRGSFNANKDKLIKLQQANTEVITIKCWFWEDPSDNTNFNKVTKTKKFAVNSSVAQLFEHAFEDIYNDPSKPVINLDDKGMGTWVLRGKNHNGNNTMSSHSLGCAIDINPSTGSFKVNGTWYGNGYKHKRMSSNVWEQLPECHNKYHVLYDGSPIVEIFKSYGFVWGGDWTSGTDCMHFSFIGDGDNARSIGYSNYLEKQ